jgi:hypothetical protein
VTVRAFLRWLVLEKTDQARSIWERWEQPGKKPLLDADEEKLKAWAMEKDVY